MSAQQTDIEEKMPEMAENAAGEQAHSTEKPAEPSIAEGTDTAKDAESGDETLAEWLNSVDTDGHVPDFTEDSGDKTPNEPDENDKIAGLEAQLAETRDQLLRKAADFENFRKRMNQEKQRAIEYANESLLLDIIPVLDDFERAIQSAETSEELIALPAGKAMLDGITMIEKRLISQLESKWGLKQFNSAGEPFNPNIHEAMLMEKSGDIEEPVVQEDLIRGYMLKDRVIRAAKVKVLMPEEKGE